MLLEIGRSLKSDLDSAIHQNNSTAQLYIVPIYLDLGLLRANTPTIFFNLLFEKIRERLSMFHADWTPFDTSNISIVDIESRFAQVARILRSVTPALRIAVLLDDVEYLVDSPSMVDLLPQLYALLNNHADISDAFTVAVTVSGSRETSASIHSHIPLIEHQLNVIRLRVLNRTDALELITKPLEGDLTFSRTQAEEIYRCTGGHPFLIQYVRSNFKNPRTQSLSQLYEKFMEERQDFHAWFRDMNNLDQEVVTFIASKQLVGCTLGELVQHLKSFAPTTNSIDQTSGPISPQEVNHSLDVLMNAGVVAPINMDQVPTPIFGYTARSTEKFYCPSQWFREWLSQYMFTRDRLSEEARAGNFTRKTDSLKPALSDEVETFIETIVNEILKNKCAFFLGAGVPSEIGFPSGTDLALDLSRTFKYEFLRGRDLPTIAEHVQINLGRKVLVSHIQELLKPIVDSVSVLPKMCSVLVSLKEVNTIITTNWDDLLENACRRVRSCHVIYNDRTAALADPSKLNIYKIHGDLDDPFGMVVAKSDYDTYSRNNPNLVRILEQILLTKTLIVVGYSLDDRDFQDRYNAVYIDTKNSGGGMSPLFVVEPYPSEDRTTFWRSKGARYIPMKANDLAEVLADRIAKARKSPNAYPDPLDGVAKPDGSRKTAGSLLDQIQKPPK
jgi:hypothetical protein